VRLLDTEYPQSWYAATKDAAPDHPSLSGKIQCDVAVVGGGFAGLHTARLLAKQGKDVVLVERRKVGWGASGRNGGFVGAGYAERSGALIDKLGIEHARKLYALSQRGVELVRDAGATRPGILMGIGKLTLSRTDQGHGFAGRTQMLALKLGASFEPWTTEQTRALLSTERYFQAVHDPKSFQIHPLNLALALASELPRVFEHTEAVALEPNKVVTTNGEISAKHIVLAGNADIGGLHRKVASAVLPVATYVAVTERLGHKLADAVCWQGSISDTRRAGDYYRVVDGDRLLWGGRITTDTREPPRLREMMRGDIISVYPQLGDVRIEWAWPGIMGYALHKMPQVGRIAPGLWVCTAFGGHGVAQTAAGAIAVANGIAGNDEDWRLFDPFGIVWAGGPFGRIGVQASYWSMQARDWWDERR
jgi:gamma-glutamylputrescine oxidase